jgi:ubiquinone/menaquinone biosynthesis C-methylase UbiE
LPRGRLGGLIADDARVTGVDVSAVVAERGRDHAGRGNMRFAVMDAHHLEFSDQAFDDVLCRCIGT